MARKHILYRSIFHHREKGKQELGEQLIIRVGKWCNFRCVFCNVAENENVLSIKSSIKEILAITFYKIKYSNFSSKELNVTISWGEPSIFQKETLFILKFFKKYFEERWMDVHFDLQSNASNIDRDFARRIRDHWVTQALISSHTHDPDIFQKIIWVSYETMWPRFEAWVQNLIDAGIFVTFNIVLNKMTATTYLDHLAYLVKKYPTVSLYNIGYVQPHGMAQENFEILVAQYKDISKIYNQGIWYLKSMWKIVHSHFVGLPLCYMDDWVTSMEYVNNVSLIRWENNDKTLIQSINDTNKIHAKDCNRCMAKRVCSGIWKEYEKVQELHPIPYEVRYSLDRFDDLPIGELRKLYTWGRRQFFFRFEHREDTSLFQQVKSLWFVWITLLFSIDNPIPNLEEYASMNFQVHVTRENMDSWIDRVRSYNATVSFQFQIQLDLIFLEDTIDIKWLRNVESKLWKNIHIHIDYRSTQRKIKSPFIHYYSH